MPLKMANTKIFHIETTRSSASPPYDEYALSIAVSAAFTRPPAPIFAPRLARQHVIAAQHYIWMAAIVCRSSGHHGTMAALRDTGVLTRRPGRTARQDAKAEHEGRAAVQNVLQLPGSPDRAVIRLTHKLNRYVTGKTGQCHESMTCGFAMSSTCHIRPLDCASNPGQPEAPQVTACAHHEKDLICV